MTNIAIQTWKDALFSSFQELWGGVIAFVPKLVAAVIIFIIGWMIAVALGKLVARVIKSIKVDRALQAAGVEEPLAQAGFRLNSGEFFGALVRWFFIIVFLMAALEIIGLDDVNMFLQRVVLGYIPSVIVAALVLVVAAFLAPVMQKIVVGSAKAAGAPSVNLLGGITKWAIWTFFILIAVDQLKLAGVFPETLLIGFIAMLALAGGLAFGLGGRDAAARYLEKLRNDIKGE